MIVRTHGRVIDLTKIPDQRTDSGAELLVNARMVTTRSRRRRTQSAAIVTGSVCLVFGFALGMALHPSGSTTGSQTQQPVANLAPMLVGVGTEGVVLTNAASVGGRSIDWLFALPVKRPARCSIEAAGWRGITYVPR